MGTPLYVRPFSLDWQAALALTQPGAACCAAAFGIYITQPTLHSPLLPLAIALMWAGVWLLPRRQPDKPLLVLFGVIVGSAWLAVPISYFHPMTNFTASIWLAILTSVLVPLAWIKDPRPILFWMVPVFLLQAALILYQGLIMATVRAGGMAQNINAGAGFLLLGAVFLVMQKGAVKWLAVPLVAALPLTGARWVLVVGVVVLAGIFCVRNVHWRYVAVGVALAVLVVSAAGWGTVYPSLARTSTLGWHVVGREYSHQPDLPASFLPRGFYDSGIHTQVWRMAHESGVVSALAWIGATAYGLWRRPRYDYRWWLLLMLALLSAMYYWTWLSALAPYWWLLLGGRRS